MFRHLACGAALAMLLAADSWAVLRHRYTFEDGNANDSAGTAHGTLAPGTMIFAGQVTLPGGGASITPAQHVALPGPTIGINTYPAATIEMWVSVLRPAAAADPGFTWAAGFGREGTATDIGPAPDDNPDQEIWGHDYIMFNVTRGLGGPSRLAITDDYFNSETGVDGANLLGDGQTHLAATFSSTGVDATTVSYYVDGTLVASATGADDLADVSNQLIYLGRSLYDNDPYFAGSINEFRIHDNAMSAAQVQASFTTGPTGPAGPTLTINRDTGAVAFSNLNDAVQIVGYTIDSQVGALDTAAWQPIQGRLDDTGNGTFDSDDNWFVTSQTVNSLAEMSVADGVGADNGAALGATSVALGTGVWERYYQEEVSATLRVRIDAFTEITFPADVAYTGNGGQPFRRGDLNFDGAINGNDWVLFRANVGATLTAGLNDAQSYPMGDIDGDQDVDFLDFRLFQGDFDDVNGVGALAAIAGAVPEPGSCVVMAASSGVLAMARRRRRDC